MRILSLIPVFALAALTLPLSAQVVTLEPSDTGLKVNIDGQLFTEYVTKDVPRPFFYPVIGAAGENIVRNFPMKSDVPGEPQDHKHHRGLWFAHGLVNGEDFWMEEKNFGTQQHVEFTDVSAEGSKGSFVATTKWVNAKEKTLMTDSRKITITALPNGEKLLDFDITLLASEDEVVLGDTKEGSMAIRLCPSLTFDNKDKEKNTGRAFNSEGQKNKSIWGKPAKWVSYHGPDPKGNQVAVSMFGHPSNYRNPMTWHARDYGLFAANPFGLHDFEKKEDQPHLGDYKIAKGESLALRFRFYLSGGKPKPEVLEEKFNSYSAE